VNMKNLHLILLFLLIGIFAFATSEGTETYTAEDAPWDDGTAVLHRWNLSAKWEFLSLQKADSLGVYQEIFNEFSPSGQFKETGLNPDTKYQYRLVAYNEDRSDSTSLFSETTTQQQWFAMNKLPLLILLVIVCSSVLYYILSARKGKELFIRRISGLDSIDEAIGRATEKGKPILFVPGISDLGDIQTIAALNILNQVAMKSAEYGTEILVPCRFSMVMSAARETVKDGYLKAGKPDAYKEDNIFYVTDDQFGFVAGVDGIMLRELPAANFFLGAFWAESLILAETGFTTGAIQTAGTGQPHQLPFFVVSCDYTLIGEELYAASAYLSRDPQQLGSLKGQDFGKLLTIILILAGIIAEIAGLGWFKNFFEGVF
jgi:cell division protein FtsL